MWRQGASRVVIGVAVAAALLATAGTARAQAGEWRIGGRVLAVSTDARTPPFGGAGSAVRFDNAWSAALDVTTVVADQWAVSMMLTTAPHDLQAGGGGLAGLDLGETWVAQSTVTLQYHVPLWGPWSPYVGAGLGLAWLHSSDTSAAAAAAGIAELRSDVLSGVAVQAGVTYRASGRWLLSADITYSGAQGEVRVVDADGATTARLDTPFEPWLVGVGAAYRF
jgi:outer membrane protein